MPAIETAVAKKIPHTCFGRGAKSIPRDPLHIGFSHAGTCEIRANDFAIYAVQMHGFLHKSVEIAQLCCPALRGTDCDTALAGGEACNPPRAAEKPASVFTHPIEHVCGRAAALAADCVRALSSDLSTSVSFSVDFASATATVSVAHVAGGRGDLVIRAHHGYLYLDRGKSDPKLPREITEAAREAVRAFADLHGHRHP